MLMDINCSAVVSIAIDLKFDCGNVKRCVIGKGDIVSIEYNNNGVRMYVYGQVTNISCYGDESKDWYLIVDGIKISTRQGINRFSVMNIVDCEVVVKQSENIPILTPNNTTCIKGFRFYDDYVQYTVNGIDWFNIVEERTENPEEVVKEIFDMAYSDVFGTESEGEDNE